MTDAFQILLAEYEDANALAMGTATRIRDRNLSHFANIVGEVRAHFQEQKNKLEQANQQVENLMKNNAEWKDKAADAAGEADKLKHVIERQQQELVRTQQEDRA